MNAMSLRANLIKQLLVTVGPENEITGLEIGVWKGDLLLSLLKEMPKIKRLYGIDPWSQSLTVRRRWGQELWDRVYKDVLSTFTEEKRVVLIRGKSQDVVDLVPDDLSFIEIDGDHTKSQVLADLELYEPKVKNGGLFCGHDYYGPQSRWVKRVVDVFAMQKGKTVQSKGSGPNEEGMWWWYK